MILFENIQNIVQNSYFIICFENISSKKSCISKIENVILK